LGGRSCSSSNNKSREMADSPEKRDPLLSGAGSGEGGRAKELAAVETKDRISSCCSRHRDWLISGGKVR